MENKSDELRNVEILKDGIWKEMKFTDLQKEDIFRMFEPDGTQVVGRSGSTEFKVISDVYTHPEYKVPTVNVEDMSANSEDV